MSCSKQQPLQPPRPLPAPRSGLGLHSTVFPRSPQHFRATAGEEQEKKVVSRVNRQHNGLQRIRTRMAHTNLNFYSSIRCSTRQEGHNLSHGSRFDSGRYLKTRSAAANFSCAARAALSIEIPRGRVGNALFRAVRRSRRRVKNMRGFNV